MNMNLIPVLLAGLLAGAAQAAEPPPYGSKDFYPSAERPIGYRGDGTGHSPGATPPLEFSEKDGKNVLWSIKMPNWGQSSPVVVGKRVITMAEPDTTICVDADTGKVLWQDALGLFPKLVLDPENTKESGKYIFLWCGHGYSWPCSDGERVVKAWISGKSKGGATAALVCYEVATGKRLWLIEFSGDHRTHKFTYEAGRWAWRNSEGAAATVQHSDWAPSGFASPQMYGDTVIYQARGARPVLVALDTKTGAQRWVSPPSVFGVSGSDANFLVLKVASRDVLVTNIGTVLDPKTGKVLGGAIPSVERDGERVSRLWGAMETTPKGGVKVAGLSPITGPGAEGVVAFGPDWPRTDAAEPADTEPSGKGAYHYLAVRLGFDAQGKLKTACLFPDRAVVPKLEYGNAHLTILKDRLIVMPGYGSSLAAIALDSGQLAVPPKQLWKKPRPADIKPDPNAPDIKAGLEEFGLTIAAVTEFGRGMGRNGYSSYSRTFVDGRGYIWTMNRQAQFYRIDPAKDFAPELAGTLVHPACWTSTWRKTRRSARGSRPSSSAAWQHCRRNCPACRVRASAPTGARTAADWAST